ncbi:hypothetical protein B9Z55_006478 [Caenorhabditis nigoni]|uniref:Uncharacterized protein n=1 Tax=Caenorhabditis nigoni TaxID=1611254 RepID=A0A2G5V632_9PELO|nr:hypothetical protein B9Z55_006478 [Caenorhabditis nigoni]
MKDDSLIVGTEETEEERFTDTICALNEVWMECSSCERECGKPLEPCDKMCHPARCQCPEHSGYGRNDQGECVYCPN